MYDNRTSMCNIRFRFLVFSRVYTFVTLISSFVVKHLQDYISTFAALFPEIYGRLIEKEKYIYTRIICE